MMEPIRFIEFLLLPIWIFLGHVFVNRAIRSLGFSRQLVVFFTAITVTFLVALSLSFSERGFSLSVFIFTLVVGLQFAHIYFHFFNMSETARRIKILVDLKRGGSSEQKTYAPGEMVSLRLQRLREAQQVEFDGTTYRAKRSAFLFIVWVMKWYERLLFSERRFTRNN